MASMRLKLVRAAFSASEQVAPKATGKLAFQMFCRTPNPSRLTPGEQRALDGAATFMADARHHRVALGNICLGIHEFRPQPQEAERGRVLVVHGWRSRTEYMRTLIEALRAAGYRVYSLDLPGHGASSGRKLDLSLGVQAIKAASDWFGPFVAVVGHSFGGAIAINAAVGSIPGIAATPFGRIVTIASPSVIGDIFSDFSDLVGLGQRTRKSLNDQVRRLSGRPLADFQSGALLARMPIETLVIHAHDDREVGPEHAEKVAMAGSHVQLQWHDGLGHRRIIADENVARAVVQFVAAPMTRKLAA